MAGAGIQPIGAVRTEGLYSIPIEHGVEAASQSYKKGMLLIYSSGKLTVWTADADNIVGISCSAATGVTSADVPYIPALPDSIIFEVSMDGALSTNAPATGKPSDLTIGATYGASIDGATGLAYLDSSKDVSGQEEIWRLVDYDADQASVIQGRVRVRFLRINTEGDHPTIYW